MQKIKTIDELSDLEQMALIPISYSRLSNFNDCHAKYFYSYITKEERLFSAPASLGNIVHEVLEQLFVSEDKYSEVDIILMMEESIRNYDPDKVISEDDIALGLQMIFNYLDTYGLRDVKKKTQFKPGDIEYITEFPFAIVVGRALLNGFIDRIMVTDSTVTIVDLKTGKWEVANKDISTNLQLCIYGVIANHMFPNRTVRAELHYLRSGRVKGHTFTEEDFVAIYERLEENIDQLINEYHFSPTQNVRACYMCDHGKTEVCNTGKMRLGKKRA